MSLFVRSRQTRAAQAPPTSYMLLGHYRDRTLTRKFNIKGSSIWVQ